ncbi:cytochrome c oxidase subunit I [Iodidimonas sp. SYSU 1G8]|uniref:cytochrome c oxidase subunit I n=1 Tax=Iodidimonas sp. SYSU 1G8 TaxID=3133967 RepID=UPI0031FF4334
MMKDTHRQALRLHRLLQPLWDAPPGRFGFLADVNHSVIGKRFMVTALVYFLIGGVLAMLIRAQLAGPHTQFLDAASYSQVFTMHGTVMMFLFAIPLIEGFTIYMLPKLLGTRDLAFPRLGAFGYWCYLFGGLLLIIGMLAGVAPDSGWFMYTPLSSKPFSPGINSDLWLIGVTFVEVSAVCAAIEFMVTVLKVRAGGMSLARMPLLCWYLWVTAAMMLVGFPPLILGSILLELERAFGLPFFDPTRGGDPLLWQHLFWLFGHPEVYIIFLPAAGVISTIIPVFAGRPIIGYGWIVGALIAQAFISFGLWVHHMFTTGIPHLSLAFFSAASLLVVVPTAVQVFAWLATLLSGRPRLTLPMLYVLGFFFTFVAGGLTGVMVAVVPFDWQAHDTHFIVAHLHYVLIGGFVFPAMAGIYYWLPHITGRRSDTGLGKTAFWVVFTGFHAGFLLMHLTGLLGMPRRVYTYPGGLGWDTLNLISSIGGFVMAIGFAMVLIDLVLQWRFAPHAKKNPWRAGTLEWAMAIPPTTYNIASIPKIEHRDPLHHDPSLPAALAAGAGYLAGAPRNRRETLCVDPVTGQPDQVLVLPGPSYLPLVAALATGLFFVAFLFKLYWLSAIGAVAVLALSLIWMWRSGLREDPEPIDIGFGEHVLPHAASDRSTAWWAMVFTLTVDAAFFAALVFGYLFLWLIAPNWPPPRLVDPGLGVPAATTLALSVAVLAARRARACNARGSAAGREAALLAAAIAGVLAMAGFLAVPFWLAPPPTEHAYGAVVAVLAGYGAFHALIAAIASAYSFLRSRAGFMSAMRAIDAVNQDMFWRYAALTGLVILVLVHGLPRWAGA